MMNCKDIRELLLTDYVDGEINESARKAIDDHLVSCQSCKEFALAAKQAAFDPFSDAERFSPPESVWHSIKERIVEVSKEDSISENILSLEKIKKVFVLPRPAIALVSILIVVLSVTSFVRTSSQKIALENEEQAIVYLAMLDEEDDSEPGEFGTSIEEYFL
ncbi:MAG: zf-HC2 domain-containing protein [Candidatus Aceula lacicola]|nr:zf-HC2 domain-containing protein [Candidatus Aceula lacicola]